MLEILERINADSSDIGLMVELFATLRPRAHDGAPPPPTCAPCASC
jgi:hypothetical protein